MDSSRAAKLIPPDADLSGRCGVLIPAFDEAETIAGIIRVAKAAELGSILVVDDGSSDATTERALAAGAAVLQLAQNQGKGGAVWAGAKTLNTDILLLIDADLIGLKPEHLQALAKPVLEGQADMARGVFTGGRWRTTAAQQITPQLNGQRALIREKLLALPNFSESRYGIEIVITQGAKRANWRCVDVALQDVSQVMKEEKRGFWQGFKYRLGMYRDLIKAMLKDMRERS